eukprot:CAMPEP_0174839330 /NCGR_PEP_ID=MMETSP1114-20130205/7968_1 /TAXON_ID=312471 /ORGANISM="Neobodo designis, Strain CCAP 1951/1" /LENGTH=800 /DNA_ID=CAMNT_0016073453 /DNA_START=189 /DNA_END=2591 /DNA_ORIENTATION=+
MKLVGVIASCATLVALAVIIILVPTILASVRRAKDSARAQSLALHGGAVNDLTCKITRLIDSSRLWISLLERGGGMDLPASLNTLLPVAWSTLTSNEAVEQLTYGTAGNEGVAMDSPLSLAGQNYSATSTKLKLRIANTSTHCRQTLHWDAADPLIDINDINRTVLQTRCNYVYPQRSWYRFVANRTQHSASTELVMTPLEPNFTGEYVAAAVGRYVRSLTPTARPETDRGVGVVDFSTRAMTQAFSATPLSRRGIMGIFVAGTEQIMGMAPALESLARRANASDPDSDVVGLKEVQHLRVDNLFRRVGGALAPILREPRVFGTRTTEIKAAGLTLIANYVDIHELGGTLHWRVVLLTPEEDFTDEVTRQRNITLGVCIPVCVLLIIAQCVIMYRLVAVPLGDISEAMEDTAALRPSTDVVAESPVTEIQAIQGSFVTMSGQLSKLRSYVPQAVLARLSGADDDDDEEGGESASEKRCDPASTPSNTSRRSRQSSSSTQSRFLVGAPGTVPAAGTGFALFDAGVLEPKPCSAVVVVNLRGFGSSTAERATELHANMTRKVLDVAKTYRGALDYFHGDHYFVTFNSTVMCAAPANKAASFVNALRDACWNMAGNAPLSIGVAAGKTNAGFLGCDGTRKFSTVGKCFMDAMALERRCAQLQNKHGLLDDGTVGSLFALVTERVARDTETTLYYLAMGLRNRVGVNDGVAFALVRARSATAGSDAGDQEWLYVVGEGDSDDPFKTHNAAFNELAHGRVMEASHALPSVKGCAEGPQAAVRPLLAASTDELHTVLRTMSVVAAE